MNKFSACVHVWGGVQVGFLIFETHTQTHVCNFSTSKGWLEVAD